MAYKAFKKYASKARKIVRKVAKKTVDARRKYGIVKRGKVSTMGVTKALANLKARVNSMAEYKTLDEAHTTGSPDVSLRQYYSITASAALAVVGNTTTPPTAGYFLQKITNPTRGDGLTNFDGKRYHVSSLQWKGSLFMPTTSNEGSLKMYIVSYSDEDMDAFQMSEFLNVDNNGEYSIASKRNPDYKGYRILASRTFKLGAGTTRRKDFNIFTKPHKLVKLFKDDDAIVSTQFYCVIVGSSDVGAALSPIFYQGNTRMRFIA